MKSRTDCGKNTTKQDKCSMSHFQDPWPRKWHFWKLAAVHRRMVRRPRCWSGNKHVWKCWDGWTCLKMVMFLRNQWNRPFCGEVVSCSCWTSSVCCVGCAETSSSWRLARWRAKECGTSVELTGYPKVLIWSLRFRWKFIVFVCFLNQLKMSDIEICSLR